MPPEPDRFGTDYYASLVQQVLDISEGQGKADARHHWFVFGPENGLLAGQEINYTCRMDQRSSDASPLTAIRTRETRISAIKEMSIRSSMVPDAVSLAWGLPSFRTPEHVREATACALENDPQAGMYALPAGLPELRQAAATEFKRKTARVVDPDSEVMITSGNMEGLNTLFQVILDPGDEVIVTDPGFVSHFQQIRYSGGVPVHWRMDEARGWEPDPDDLPDLISKRTKALVLVTPSNPTGRILAESTLRTVARLAKLHQFLVILDDPYSYFTYENRDRYFDLAGLPDVAENLAYLFTFSKAFAMSGWRVGYMVMPASLREQVVKIHDMTMICTPRISQISACAALEGPRDHLAEFERILARRRQLICERLDHLDHLFRYARPEGAYYVFPKVLVERDDVAFAHRLLDQAGVTVTPGSAFGPSGAEHVRMAYCVDDAVIERAFDRIEENFPR
jgi:aminotransferase